MVSHDVTMRHRVIWVEREEFHDNPIYFFHHYHIEEHKKNPSQPAVEHCGISHFRIDPYLTYSIHHCRCGFHGIDQEVAIGHDERRRETWFRFEERCREDKCLWHLESGVIIKRGK